MGVEFTDLTYTVEVFEVLDEHGQPIEHLTADEATRLAHVLRQPYSRWQLAGAGVQILAAIEAQMMGRSTERSQLRRQFRNGLGGTGVVCVEVATALDRVRAVCPDPDSTHPEQLRHQLELAGHRRLLADEVDQLVAEPNWSAVPA